MFRCLKRQKIQGTYFKISALYFKIYGLYFLRQAMCFFGGAQCAFKNRFAKRKFQLSSAISNRDFLYATVAFVNFTPFSRGDAFALLECLCEIAH